jgi:hypothetical protein
MMFMNKEYLNGNPSVPNIPSFKFNRNQGVMKSMKTSTGQS